MNENNEKIGSLQWMLLIFGFVNGSVLLLSLIDAQMKHDTWLVVLGGYGLSIPFVLSYVFLSKRFPGKNLIEIHDAVYGKILGSLISAGYAGFFILLFSYNYMQIVEFYSGFVFPETNQVVLYVTVALFCSYAAKKGVFAIANVNIYAVVFWVSTLAVTFFFLLPEMDFSNLLPVFEAPPVEFAKATYTMACVTYCEILCFIFVTPYLKSAEKLGKYTVAGLGLSALLLLVVDILGSSVLGASRNIFLQSHYQAARIISIGEFLTRMELFAALAITAAMFVKISVFQFAAAKSLSTLLKLKTYTPLLLPLAAIGIVNAMVAYDSAVENMDLFKYHVVYSLPFEFIFPPLSLLVARVRRLPRPEEGAS